MPNIHLSNFNILCSLAGGLLVVYGLVSLLLTETFYIADACEYTIHEIIIIDVMILAWRGRYTYLKCVNSSCHPHRRHLLPFRREPHPTL